MQCTPSWSLVAPDNFSFTKTQLALLSFLFQSKTKSIVLLFSLTNGNHIHVFPTHHHPGLCGPARKARSQQQKARFFKLVGPSVRLARGGGLHRPKGERETETGSGAGTGPGRVKVRCWVLHRGEGETAAEKNG